jgi:hypothetical protein
VSRKYGSSGRFESTAVLRNVGNYNCSYTAQRLRRRESSGIWLLSLILIIIKIVKFFISVVIVNDDPRLKMKTVVGKMVVAVIAVCLELVCSL